MDEIFKCQNEAARLKQLNPNDDIDLNAVALNSKNCFKFF